MTAPSEKVVLGAMTKSATKGSVAIMQPYFIPYLGYFQLMASCETFVFHIDIQFPGRSWINRNRLLVNEEPKFCTIPLATHSSTAEISELDIASNFDQFRRQLIGRFDTNYAAAPFANTAREILTSILECREKKLVHFLVRSLSTICDALDLNVSTVFSSDLEIERDLKGQDRVIALVEAAAGNSYLNLPGGRHLYDAKAFEAAGCTLFFLEPFVPEYPVANGLSFPRMSILDTIAYLGLNTTKGMLNKAHLLRA